MAKIWLSTCIFFSEVYLTTHKNAPLYNAKLPTQGMICSPEHGRTLPDSGWQRHLSPSMPCQNNYLLFLLPGRHVVCGPVLFFCFPWVDLHRVLTPHGQHGAGAEHSQVPQNGPTKSQSTAKKENLEVHSTEWKGLGRKGAAEKKLV